MTNQPIWKKIGAIGDVNPFDYDGGFVYEDETGVYPAELEYIQRQSDDDNGPWKVYRVPLDRCELTTPDEETGEVYLVPFGFSARTDLPHALPTYDEWFHKDLTSVAESCGTSLDVLRNALCSANPMERAFAYEMLASYHGWENLDSYPLTVTSEEELRARYNER